jgi:antagonist of KipI
MSLLIRKAGLMDTVQDLGRRGHAHLGIHAGGAADPIGLQVANLMAGNEPGAAALEMHFPAPVLRFEQAAIFALGGADFQARLGDMNVPVGTPVRATVGSELVFRRQFRGMRSYLAVRGGFELEPWQDSYSTDLMAGAGGFRGRALQAGDRLPFRQILTGSVTSRMYPWRANVSALYPTDAAFRFLPGPEYDLLDSASCQRLEAAEWRPGRRSNRMGCLLEGPALMLRETCELVSSAVLPGTVQLLPGGDMLVLLADCQTTGGYPRIAQVVAADLPRLAQQRPGEGFRLRKVGLDEALEAGREQRRGLRRLGWGCFLMTENGVF